MKALTLMFTLTLSFPLMAESEYAHKAKALINKMIEVKKQKIKIITDAAKLPPKERACEIQRSFAYYKDNLVPLAEELEDVKYTYSARATPADEAEIALVKEKWNAIADDDNKLVIQASREIDMSLCQ